MTLELFWRGLFYTCLAWYTCVTLYVAVRGAFDIRTMLRSLSKEGRSEPRDE